MSFQVAMIKACNAQLKKACARPQVVLIEMLTNLISVAAEEERKITKKELTSLVKGVFGAITFDDEDEKPASPKVEKKVTTKKTPAKAKKNVH